MPIYDIEEDARLFIAAREFATNSGPIDALGFDEKGNIYVVETKLYKNPDKRTVVAQALDYGASLWRHATDFGEFVNQLDIHAQKQFQKSFREALESFYGLDDSSEIMEAIKIHLCTGVIKFVILMDTLHDRLKDLIVYVNQNSKFDLYAVELAYYKYDEFEIIIPKIYGAEVKKDVTSHATAGARRRWDEVSFIREIEKLSSDTGHAIMKLYHWAKLSASTVNWGTGTNRGSISPCFDIISSTKSFLTLYSDGTIEIKYGFLPNDELRTRLRSTLEKYLPNSSVAEIPSERELDSYSPSLAPKYVTTHIDKIITALTEFVSS